MNILRIHTVKLKNDVASYYVSLFKWTCSCHSTYPAEQFTLKRCVGRS